MKKRKIGIITLPLHTNYGGILQAFALVTVLKNIGHEPWLIKRESSPVPRLKRIKIITKQLVKKYILGRTNINIDFTSSHVKKRRREITRQHTQRFITQYISPHTDYYYSSDALARNINKYQFDACIVGSDQVWRPRYAADKLQDFFLGFLNGSQTKRIAYAASFGTEDWEFSQEQTQQCAKLLKEFDAVSVRENSGVELCKKKFGVAVEQVLDPTLLLQQRDYLKLIRQNDNQKLVELFVYLIDTTADKEIVISNIASHFDYTVSRINKVTLREESLGLPEQPVVSSVEDWLDNFANAKFIITDSFHGCAFAILFNRPFVVYASLSRGLSRFTSLLSIFELENRLIYSSEELSDKLLADIDWERVNAILAENREQALLFLTNALS